MKLILLVKLALTICVHATETPSTLANLSDMLNPTKDTVTLDYAQIQGMLKSNHREFLGIPFAEPPMGKLRFKPPQFIKNKQLNISATSFGYDCWQKPTGLHNIGFTNRSEDCLTLNIWTPLNTTIDTRLPVAVVVYGGGFDSGFSAHEYYNLGRVITDNIVLVTFNYRVSAFGFLASRELKDKESLNLGLMDIELAFKWVRKYIHKFGGNNDRVTAVGHSAGAISLSLLMMNQEKLFDQAVVMSGGPPLVLKTPEQSETDYEKFKSKLNCTTLECLESKTAEDLYLASKGMSFYPCIDGTLIKTQPLVTYLKGDYQKMPLLLTNVKDEGNLFTFPMVKTFNEVLPTEKLLLSFLSNSTIDKIQQLYSPADYKYPFQVVGDIYGDFLFQCPSYLLEKLGLASNQQVYRSMFEVDGTDPIGVAHGSDLPYLFSHSNAKYPNISNAMTKMWMDFAQSKQSEILKPNATILFTNNNAEMVQQSFPKCGFWYQTMVSVFQSFNKN